MGSHNMVSVGDLGVRLCGFRLGFVDYDVW